MSRERRGLRIALAFALLGAACTPAAQPLADFDDIAWIAALTRDSDGTIVAGSEIRRLNGPIDLLTTTDEPIIVAGWTADAFAALRPDPAIAIAPRTGCAPRLPTPARAALVDAAGQSAPADPARLPPLTAAWAAPLCAARDPAAYAYRADCLEGRTAAAVMPTTACTFQLALDGIDAALGARIEPDGDLCLEAASDGGPTCAAIPARGLADASLVCSLPSACTIDVYAPPPAAKLRATRAPLLDAPPFIPDVGLTGMQPQVPPLGGLVGYTHDVVVAGDRVIASTSTGAARVLCGNGASPSVLHALVDTEDGLTVTATAAAPSCLTLLATLTSTTFAGVHVRGEAFAVSRFDADTLRALDTLPLGEASEARPGCARPIELLADGDRLLVVMERLATCAAPGTTVHVLDRRTLAARAHVDLDAVTPWHVLLDDDGALLIAEATARTVARYDRDTFALLSRVVLPPDLTRNDTVIADLALDGGALLAATTRNQPLIRRSVGGRDFADRGFFIAHEADPVALSPAFAGALGLVIGTRDGDPRRWPTEAALYDPDTLTVLPGELPIGHGPPRRVRRDDRGGAIVLLAWEATIVRITPAR